MARRTSLRDYQLSLATRLRDLASRNAVASKLGFQVGRDSWFVSLTDVSEVIPVPQIMPVSLTRAWFCGIANVRGNLYGIADFSAFQGAEPIGPGTERRVILIAEKKIAGSGLMVSRMLGLRNPEQFVSESAPEPLLPWIKGIFRDATGTRWHELDIAALVHQEQFLEVGA